MASTNISSALRMSLGFKRCLRWRAAVRAGPAARIASGPCEPAESQTGARPGQDLGPCQGYERDPAPGCSLGFDPGEEFATNGDGPGVGAVGRGQLVAETGFEPVTKGL